MWPVQELLSHSRSAQFYFCMDQKKKACQHDADPATRGLWVVLWSEGKGNCRAYHLQPVLWPRASNAQLPESAQAGLAGLLFWVPGFWSLVLETGPGELLWLDHFLRKWLRLPSSGKLHPWVPLGLVGSRNNTPNGCLWSRDLEGLLQSLWLGQCLGFNYLRLLCYSTYRQYFL